MSTSECIITFGGSGEPASAPTWSLAAAAASSAATLPMKPACPLTHLKVTCVPIRVERLFSASTVSSTSLDLMCTEFRALTEAWESEYMVMLSPIDMGGVYENSRSLIN